MSTSRILSQHGNVIAADFKPRTSSELVITLKTETLYCDGIVTLIRCTGDFAGKTYFSTHILGDLTTGHIVQL